MATYLPGVTDYIPHIQPFRPDFNFYQKALETKEAQYKSGYDKISNLYGMLLNSEMSREPNLKKREEFFKNVQGQIQRMSTVDLSLEQNVNAAYRVFQPIIDDKNITHDIVYTKQYRAQKNKGQQLKNCTDPKKCGGAKWWQEGDLELDYKRQEYAQADDQAALAMRAPTYTPATDIQGKLNAAAKAYGIEVQSVTHTKDGYNITTTGGQQLVGPLKNYFTSIIMNDPLAQGMYRTKGYLARKNFSFENAQKYGSAEAAERVYLQDKIRIINEAMEHPKKETNTVLDLLNSQVKYVENKIKTEGVPVSQAKEVSSAWEGLMQQIEANTAVKDHLEETTSGIVPGELLGLDTETLRARVDAAVAKASLTMDMARYAQNYADLHKKVTKEADPYDKMAREHLYAQEMEELRDLHKKENIAFAHALKTGEEKGTGKLKVKETAPAPGATALVSLEKSNLEARNEYLGQTRDAALDLVNSSYNKYRAIYDNPPTNKDGSINAAAKENARLALISIFGGRDTNTGYLDDNYKLKYPDFKRNPGIHDISSYDNWENLYKRTLQVNRSNSAKPGMLGDQQVAELSSLEANFNLKKRVRDVVIDKYNTNRGKVYDYLKYYGKSKHKDSADIVKASNNLNDFINNYKKAYGDSYIEADRLDEIENDAKEAWTELHEEYREVYKENPNNMLESINPSVSTGGGGVIAAGNQAYFDASKKAGESLAYIESIKNDLLDPTAVALAGDNKAIEEGDTPALEQEGDPALKNVVKYWLDQYTNRTWKKGEPGYINRPIANITYHDVAGNDANTVAVEFDFNQGWAEKERGSANVSKTVDALFTDEGYNGKVTVYMDKSKAQNLMTRRSKTSDLEMLLSNGGKLVVDNYKDFGGVAVIERDAKGLKVSGSINYTDDEGNILTTPLEERRANTNNPEAFRKTVLDILAIPNKANIAARWNIYNAQKKAFSIEEINQMLQNAGQ